MKLLLYYLRPGNLTYNAVPSTNLEILDDLERQGRLIYTHQDTYDDRFMLQLATERNAAILTNDKFRDLKRESLAFRQIIEERLLTFTFAEDFIMVSDNPNGQHRPRLSEILSLS